MCDVQALTRLYDNRKGINCLDRFIPPRKYLDFEYSYFSIVNSSPVKQNADILEQNTKEWPVHNYETSLNKFLINNLHSNRVLPFNMKKNICNKANHTVHWPVKPRLKPIIGSPWAVLDLPNFVNAFDRNLLHWGKRNYIAAALWDSVYLWNSQTSMTVAIPNPTATAIKWNSDGNNLFIANRKGLIVWDAETLKSKVTYSQKHCNEFKCSVTAVDWFPFGNVQVTGCDHGGIVMYSENGLRKVINDGQSGNIFFSIVSISFSFNGRYFATSNFESVVNIWTFPDGLLYFKIKTFGSTRGMAWHPIQHSYLCVGDTSGVMALWNVNNKKCIADHHPIVKKSVGVYSLTFSELSSELVTSHLLFDQDEQNLNLSQINVLASFDRVVDRIEGQHDGRILYLEWSPDGTQIATAGSDETLQIWNFTNHCDKNMKKNRKQMFMSKDICYTEKFNCSIR